jgi:hypothetical protein
MSLYRSVKLLYSLTFSMLYFILWNVLAFIIIRLMPDTRVFILALVMVALMQFLSARYSKKALIFLPSCILGAVTLFLIYGTSDYLANIIYVVLNMFYLAKDDEDSIEYSSYRRRVIIGIYSLVAIGIILLAVNGEFRDYLLRFYILFLSSSIILLRESRRFRYNIKGKKSILTNIMVMISVVILSMDKVYNLVSFAIKTFWIGLGYITGFLVVIIIRLLAPLINYLEIQQNKPVEIKGMQPAEVAPGKLIEELLNIQEGGIREIPQEVVLAFRITMLLITAFTAYKFYKSYKYSKNNVNEGIIEKREKIARTSTRKKNSFVSTLKEIFTEKDLKAQILKIYGSFEKKTYEKNIFKKNMTATQLYNVSKAYIDNVESVKNITEVYNKTKFSQYSASESELKEIKENYRSIKDEIDNIKN